MRLTFIAALALPLLLAPAAEAPNRQSDPDVVKAAIRRRAEAWLRDRAQKGLACRTCGCVADRVAGCADCGGIGLSKKKADSALWGYLVSSVRNAGGEERKRAYLEMKPGGQWGDLPYAVAGVAPALVVTSVVISRDAAWVYYAPGGDTEREQGSVWVREDDGFYLCLTLKYGETLVDHEWFSSEAMSIGRLCLEIERLAESVDAQGITELERTRRKEARGERERRMRQRWVSDYGRVVEVKPLGANGDDPGELGAYVVSVYVDRCIVNVTVRAAGDPKALEDRLASLPMFSCVFLRGRVEAWAINEEQRAGWVGTLDLVDGEVAATK